MLGRYTTGLLALWSFKAGFFLISILACGVASGSGGVIEILEALGINIVRRDERPS